MDTYPLDAEASLGDVMLTAADWATVAEVVATLRATIADAPAYRLDGKTRRALAKQLKRLDDVQLCRVELLS